MSAEPPIPRVFICYARADNESPDRRERWLDRLRQHLRPYESQGEIEVFVDSIIELGADWHEEIQGQLREARVVVLLVSSAFLASSYVGSSELPVLLQRAREGGLKIIPVIVSPCGFDEVSFRYPDPKTGPERKRLSTLQSANSPKETLYQLGYGEQERVLSDVARAVRRFASVPVSRPVQPAVPPAPPAPAPRPAAPDRSRAAKTREEPVRPAAAPAISTPRSGALVEPGWAQRVWQDEFGGAAEFTLGGVVFVLR